MKGIFIYSLVAACGIFAAVNPVRAAAHPNDSETNNPFAEIFERNVFGLKPEPELKPQEAAKPQSNIKLTGFEQHGSQPTRVLLAELPKDPKEQMKLFNLGAGEKQDGLEVTKIYPDHTAVEVVVDGVPEILTVRSNTLLTAYTSKR